MIGHCVKVTRPGEEKKNCSFMTIINIQKIEILYLLEHKPYLRFWPGSALQFFMTCNGWTRLWPKNNANHIASSPVSRAQPLPRQSYPVPTFGPLLAGITDATMTSQRSVYILHVIIRLRQDGMRRRLTGWTVYQGQPDVDQSEVLNAIHSEVAQMRSVQY